MSAMETLLSQQPYIGGKDFSVSDVAVGAYLLYVPAFFPTVRAIQGGLGEEGEGLGVFGEGEGLGGLGEAGG